MAGMFSLSSRAEGIVDSEGVQLAASAGAGGSAEDAHFSADAPDVQSVRAEGAPFSTTGGPAVSAGGGIVRVVVHPARADPATAPVAAGAAINTGVACHRGNSKSLCDDSDVN